MRHEPQRHSTRSSGVLFFNHIFEGANPLLLKEGWLRPSINVAKPPWRSGVVSLTTPAASKEAPQHFLCSRGHPSFERRGLQSASLLIAVLPRCVSVVSACVTVSRILRPTFQECPHFRRRLIRNLFLRNVPGV